MIASPRRSNSAAANPDEMNTHTQSIALKSGSFRAAQAILSQIRDSLSEGGSIQMPGWDEIIADHIERITKINEMAEALNEADEMLVSCESWLCMCRDHFAEAPAMESWGASCIERVVKIRKSLRPTIHAVLVDAGLRTA